jgi:hypothetical protein
MDVLEHLKELDRSTGRRYGLCLQQRQLILLRVEKENAFYCDAA